MLKHKASLYAVLFIALSACTKQDITPSQPVAAGSVETEFFRRHQIPQPTTIFGLMEKEATTEETEADMNGAGIKLVRIPIFLSINTASKTIDDYLNSGYGVQINANWNPTADGSFPKDTNLLKSRADAFFKYYANYKAQIPFVAVENEWDYEVSLGGDIQDYFTELSIITAVGHKYGFRIADAGIRSSTLRRWTYSQLSGTVQQQWLDDYYVGLNYDYDGLLEMVNTYIDGIKKINFDYSNVHWYNPATCDNGFGTAAQAFMKASYKTGVVCNEFGIYTNLYALFDSTVNEIKSNVKYGIAYSGTSDNGLNQPIALTDAMLDLLH